MCYDGTVASMPQGDSSSPLIRGLMSALGAERVKQSASGAFLYVSVCMGDRFSAAKDPSLLRRAVAAWEEYSGLIHLIENGEKLQICNLHERPSDQMGVLGALIGGPTKETFYRYHC